MLIDVDSATALATAGDVASDPVLGPALALQGDGGTFVGWLSLLVGPGLFAAVCWSPLLLSGRIRRLFRALPPAGSVAASYLLSAVALSVPFVVGSGYVLATAPTEGAALSNALLDLVLALSIGYVVGLPALSAVGLPRIGVDWDPNEYGLGTWALLVLGALWYAALFAVPLFLVAVVFALPT